jgi:hypothetical protein
MTTNNGAHGGEWHIVGTNNRGHDGVGQERTVTEETDGRSRQVAVETRENGNNRGRTNATITNYTNEDDGMQS